jgi:hypothetical protein
MKINPNTKQHGKAAAAALLHDLGAANTHPKIALDPDLAKRLAERYPGVRILECCVTETYTGIPQQNVRFQAPLAVLVSHGLITERMLRPRRRVDHTTPLGDGFNLNERIDSLSTPGHWDLSIWTETEPRERDGMSLREAQRILKRIANKAPSRAG